MVMRRFCSSIGLAKVTVDERGLVLKLGGSPGEEGSKGESGEVDHEETVSRASRMSSGENYWFCKLRHLLSGVTGEIGVARISQSRSRPGALVVVSFCRSTMILLAMPDV